MKNGDFPRVTSPVKFRVTNEQDWAKLSPRCPKNNSKSPLASFIPILFMVFRVSHEFVCIFKPLLRCFSLELKWARNAVFVRMDR